MFRFRISQIRGGIGIKNDVLGGYRLILLRGIIVYEFSFYGLLGGLDIGRNAALALESIVVVHVEFDLSGHKIVETSIERLDDSLFGIVKQPPHHWRQRIRSFAVAVAVSVIRPPHHNHGHVGHGRRRRRRQRCGRLVFLFLVIGVNPNDLDFHAGCPGTGRKRGIPCQSVAVVSVLVFFFVFVFVIVSNGHGIVNHGEIRRQNKVLFEVFDQVPQEQNVGHVLCWSNDLLKQDFLLSHSHGGRHGIPVDGGELFRVDRKESGSFLIRRPNLRTSRTNSEGMIRSNECICLIRRAECAHEKKTHNRKGIIFGAGIHGFWTCLYAITAGCDRSLDSVL
mmetsp:Transcript_292/g.751  ORF Transcript_292/g.751 Transcript_292/m.751 type:complete len:337 (-) Transcript_292:167-1177(-)